MYDFPQGQTFGKVIQDFLEDYGPLEDYLRMYETSDEGKRLYKQCLESTELYFPQYLVELKGMADGAGVPFHKVNCVYVLRPSSRSVDMKKTDISGNKRNKIYCSWVSRFDRRRKVGNRIQ